MNPPNARLTRVDLALVLLLAALVAIFFWRILTPNPADRAQVPPGDFTDQFYAFRLVEARAFAAGHLPLWSENYNSGHPFLADVQAGVFYPIGLINTLLNVAVLGPNFPLFSLELEALFHFWLAGVFIFLFARQIMVSRAGAFGAALVFTFGGYLTSYPSLQLAILETAAWLPLALLFVRMAGTGPRQVPWLLAAGLTLGVGALAGHPQTFVFVLVACVLYQIYLDWSAQAVRSAAALLRRSAPRVLLMLAVALGLAAVQLIPSIEYQRLSTREALSFQQAAAGLPTLDLLQFIFPGFTSAFASPLYIGILPLWLAVLALARRGRERTFWGLTALGALLLSFGFYVFAYAWVYLLLPGAGLFRQQERLAFIVSFALALLAGFGLNDLAEIADRMRARAARRLYLLLPAGAALSLALLVTFFAAGVERSSGRLAFLGDRAGLMVLLFVLAALLAGARLSGRLAPRSFALLAVALVLFDLWSVNEPANKGAVADRYVPNETVETIKQDAGVFRVVADPQVVPGHWGIGYQLEETSGISPLRLARYDAVLALGPQVAARLLNVRYLVGPSPLNLPAEALGGEGARQLFRLRDPAPRAWLVQRAQENVDDAQALAALAGGLDPQQQALVTGRLPFPLDSNAAPGSVTIAARAPEYLALSVDAPGDALLILSENDYPGWQARVDGAPVPLLRADVTLRAVPVRAGPHRVEFVFDPLSFKIGLAVTVLTLIATVGALVFASSRRAAITTTE